MARRPILEKWRASRGHLSPQEPKLPWSHPVLAHLSVGYPGLEGRLPTCYSPVRRCTQGVTPLFSHDLHVLGTPPAFVLRQDQTLQLNWSAAPPEGSEADTSNDAPDLASTKNRAVRTITLGTFSAKLMGKGALLFSFQRPAASAGRRRHIRSATQLVKQRCSCFGRRRGVAPPSRAPRPFARRLRPTETRRWRPPWKRKSTPTVSPSTCTPPCDTKPAR